MLISVVQESDWVVKDVKRFKFHTWYWRVRGTYGTA